MMSSVAIPDTNIFIFTEIEEASVAMALESNFKSKYLELLSEGIEEIWEDRSFSDIVVNVGPRSYHCHKIILSSLSAYFSAMFRSGMQETLNGTVYLQNIEADVFEAVLRFMYTGNNVITQENVEGLLEAAVMLQIKCLQEQCESFLKKLIGKLLIYSLKNL